MEFLFVIIILIMSVVIHEVSHGYAALALGDPTAKYEGRLTLNPLRHLDPVGSFLIPLVGYYLGGFIIGWAKPVPYNPYNLKNAKWGEAVVAIAGPVSNFLLAVIFGLLIKFSPGSSLVNQSFFNLAGSVVLINITLAIFNLMPIPPLDGSKILSAILPYKWSSWFQSLERYGFIILIIFVFFFWQFMTPLVGKIFTLLTGYLLP